METSSDFSDDLIVVDNFLSRQELEELKNLIISSEDNEGAETLLYTAGMVVPHSYLPSDVSPIHNLQMVHSFLEMGTLSIIEKFFVPRVGVCFYQRVKANLTFCTDRIVEHGFHCDFPDHAFERGETLKCNLSHLPMKTACFYINTCDGYTVFENGKKVQSVENRYVEFDQRLKHSGTTTTNAAFRGVINFNYVPFNFFPRIQHYRY